MVNGGILYAVKVTSIVDNVKIKSIQVNRGNCPDMFGYATTFNQRVQAVNLSFSETLTRFFACKVLEADVAASQGTWTFTW